MYTYHATCDRVVDGDTVDLMVDLGFSVHTKQRIRLLGINAPEGKRTPAAERCRELLTGELLLNTKGRGKYGRYLGTITLEDGRVLNELLLEEGLAKKY